MGWRRRMYGEFSRVFNSPNCHQLAPGAIENDALKQYGFLDITRQTLVGFNGISGSTNTMRERYHHIKPTKEDYSSQCWNRHRLSRECNMHILKVIPLTKNRLKCDNCCRYWSKDDRQIFKWLTTDTTISAEVWKYYKKRLANKSCNTGLFSSRKSRSVL